MCTHTHTWLQDHNATIPQTLNQPWPHKMELYHSTTPHGYKTTVISSYAHLAGEKDKVYKGCPYIHKPDGREG